LATMITPYPCLILWPSGRPPRGAISRCQASTSDMSISGRIFSPDFLVVCFTSYSSAVCQPRPPLGLVVPPPPRFSKKGNARPVSGGAHDCPLTCFLGLFPKKTSVGLDVCYCFLFYFRFVNVSHVNDKVGLPTGYYFGVSLGKWFPSGGRGLGLQVTCLCPIYGTFFW